MVETCSASRDTLGHVGKYSMNREIFMNTSSKKHVLHVVKRLDLLGGAERIIAELVRNNPAHDVLVFGGGESFFDLGKAYPIRARNMAHAIWVCFRLRHQYTNFHLHLFPAIYLSLFLGNRSIIHEHNTHNKRRAIPVFRPIERCVYGRARSIIAISPAVKTALQDWVGTRPLIHVLPNFVATFPDAPQTPKDIPLGTGESILMVARFSAAKRQDLVIRALAHLPARIHVVFAGDGPNLNSCRDLATELGVADRVNFPGSVANVASLYLAADLCVLISHWEGFGLVVLEAAQFGKACVVSDVEGLRDVSPDPRLLFSGDDPKDLADIILKGLNLAKSDNVRRALLEYAKSFGIGEYVVHLNEVYNINSPKSAAPETLSKP